jgi:DNA-binding NtrC family response regulator
MKGTVLIVDDDRNLRVTLAEILQSCHFEVLEAENSVQALPIISEKNPDLVFCDWKMPGGGGDELLRTLKEKQHIQRLPVIVMTAYGTSGNAIKAIQLGAYDFISKPFDLDEISATAGRALEHARLQKEVESLQNRLRETPNLGGGDIVGSSPVMLEVFKDIGRVAATDTTVLIQGESGTGKELVSHSIHKNSHRASGPFVTVNCASIPGDLLESELFGHERGAFTGAVSRKAGKFEIANGGTVFLDEVGDLSANLQPKLLRVLQERAFEHVGGNELIRSDFRLIVATNRNLDEMVQEGDFRQDLYYRLNAFTIHLPPLRKRRADIIPLAEHFREVCVNRDKVPAADFSDEALIALQQYSYPGNVRELEHIVERALLQAQGRLILPEHLQLQKTFDNKNAYWTEGLMALPLHDSVAEWEKFRISKALEESAGNKAEAARRLGIHRRLLYEKMNKFGLLKDDEEPPAEN